MLDAVKMLLADRIFRSDRHCEVLSTRAAAGADDLDGERERSRGRWRPGDPSVDRIESQARRQNAGPDTIRV